MNNGNERLDRQQFENKMVEAVMEFSMLKHPFYQAWSEGGLSQSILAEYAKQYYAHVSAFPAYVSAVHSHCDKLPIRQELLENLIEEEHGAENHPELWLRFAEGLGVNREDVRQAELLPATEASVSRLKTITQSEDYRQGLAALYAYESQIPDVARTKREGLNSFYQITDERAVSFFRVHESIDLLHQDVALRTLSNECDSESAQSAAITAASEGAKALWGFLDGVAAAYLPEATDCHLATA